MFSVALKMLFGDFTKFLGLIFGIGFSTLLINQQTSIFLGLLTRSGSIIYDTSEANIWVMDPGVKTTDTIFPLRDTELTRVRGVQGVKWAVPFFKTNATLRTSQGRIYGIALIGVDDNSLIGVPREVLLGDIKNLKQPDAIALDTDGYKRIFPGEPYELGKEIELNDHRAKVTVLVKARPSFTGNAVIYTKYSRALQYSNNGRNQLSFVLAHSADGESEEVVAQRIQAATGLKALTNQQFLQSCLKFVIDNTGIPISFGMVISLGVIVGIAIVGLLFNMFVLENIKQFAVLKAIGVKNSRIIMMVLLQAGVVGVVGWTFGVTLAAFFFNMTKAVPNFRGFYLPWEVVAITAGIAFVIMLLATLFSLRRVLFVDPAIVFRG